MPTLSELREDIAKLSNDLHEVFVEAGSDMDMDKVTRLGKMDSDQKAAWIKTQHEQINALGAEIDRLENLEKIGRINQGVHAKANTPLERPPMPGTNGHANNDDGEAGARLFRQKSLRQVLLDHKGYREFRDNARREVQIDFPVADFKTLITLTTVSPQASRQDPVNMALEERTVADLMAQGQTDRNLIEYYEETTVTNAAAPVAEGGTKAESALAWTLRQENVRKVATFIPATKEALDDVPFLESQIRSRLAFMVRRAEETQVLSGSGTPPAIQGMLNRSGIQTQAKGTDPNPDAIYKAMQKVRGAGGAGFAEPTAVVINPNDWTLIKLLRTADGIYIWGNPSDEGPDRIWGKEVRQTTAMTAGTALVGAFRPFAEVVRREGVTVTLSTEHSTFFVENKVAILAESRLALAVYRPSAFATVTGIV